MSHVESEIEVDYYLRKNCDEIWTLIELNTRMCFAQKKEVLIVLEKKSPISRILSHNLKYWRTNSELTQEQVASATGISLRTYQALECAEANPTLSTLDELAKYYKVAICRLLGFSSVKLGTEETIFYDRFQKTFLFFETPVVIRDFDAQILWGNEAASRLTRTNLSEGKTSILGVKTSPAREIVKAQISAEKEGIAQPYINYSENETGDAIYFRIYPTIVFPMIGRKPLYTINYLVPITKECDSKFFNFATLLLDCIYP